MELRALPGLSRVTRALASPRRAAGSDDDRRTSHGRVGPSETDDAWNHLIGWTEIQQDHVVIRMVNETVEECNELCMPLTRESALED